MGKTISIDQLAHEIEVCLNDAKKQIDQETKKAVDAGARKAVSQLKATSPKRYGGYAGGWTSSAEGSVGSTGYSRTVYNSSKPSLTHLLEFGHAKVLWGHRTGERVSPKPHIEQAFNAGAAEMERRLGG